MCTTFDRRSLVLVSVNVCKELEINKDSNNEEVENIISIISEIRSFKNELNVAPGSFIDMSIKSIEDVQKK